MGKERGLASPHAEWNGKKKRRKRPIVWFELVDFAAKRKKIDAVLPCNLLTSNSSSQRITQPRCASIVAPYALVKTMALNDRAVLWSIMCTVKSNASHLCCQGMKRPLMLLPKEMFGWISLSLSKNGELVAMALFWDDRSLTAGSVKRGAMDEGNILLGTSQLSCYESSWSMKCGKLDILSPLGPTISGHDREATLQATFSYSFHDDELSHDDGSDDNDRARLKKRITI